TTPASEGGACSRSSSQRDGGTTREARGTGRATVDPRRGAGDCAAPGTRLADGEREGRQGEGGRDGGRSAEGHGAGAAARAAAAGPAGDGGAGGRSSSERRGRAAGEARRTGRAAVDPGGGASDRAAPGARLADGEREGWREGRCHRGRRGEGDCARPSAAAAATTPAREG